MSTFNNRTNVFLLRFVVCSAEQSISGQLKVISSVINRKFYSTKKQHDKSFNWYALFSQYLCDKELLENTIGSYELKLRWHYA